MKTILFVCVVLLTILSSGISVHCQGDSLVDNIKTIDGDVVSVDSENSQIMIKSSEVMSFSVPSSAKITDADGFTMQLSDVGVGNYVTVGYHNDKSGNHIILSMEVEYNR